ncbi:unnamed protein product [Zymoseptoria tritici ST99CH_1A5]|uniref:Uncharacterized protein n=1 Tax=Zymoseptoria tritici ST99CH_1A5 TaxID=1276529 RepID=A0A1Y6M102_ZYMTR|nr:unnamed protein product [Zymoseptoria tritici ST99CH_1A5]
MERPLTPIDSDGGNVKVVKQPKVVEAAYFCLNPTTRCLRPICSVSMAVEHASLPNGTDFEHRADERNAYTYASNNATSQQPTSTPANLSAPSQFEIPKDEVGNSSNATLRRA